MAAATAVRYSTSAVPSLTRLSPSRIVTTRRGRPIRWAVAETATGSVGETITPRTKAIGHGSPITACPTTATVTVVSSTSPTERKTIGLRLALRSLGEEKKAAE